LTNKKIYYLEKKKLIRYHKMLLWMATSQYKFLQLH